VIQNATFDKVFVAFRMSYGFNGIHNEISFMHLRRVWQFSWNLHNSLKPCVQIYCTCFHQIRVWLLWCRFLWNF